MKNLTLFRSQVFMTLLALLFAGSTAYAEVPSAPEDFSYEVHHQGNDGLLSFHWSPVETALGYRVYAELIDPLGDNLDVELLETEATDADLTMEAFAGKIGNIQMNIMDLGFYVVAFNQDGESEKRRGRGHPGGGHGGGHHNPCDVEEIGAILQAELGDDWDGNPCSLTDEEIASVNEVLDSLLDEDCKYRLHCDRTWATIEDIITSVLGDDWYAIDPCDVTDEQREAIYEAVVEELGEEAGAMLGENLECLFPCHGKGGGHPPHGDPCDYEAVDSIMIAIAGNEWSGDPCDLTEEEIESINEAIEEHFDGECRFRVHCDRTWKTIEEIFIEVAGDNWNGDPCSLTQDQKDEIIERIEEELGEEIAEMMEHHLDFPCPPSEEDWVLADSIISSVAGDNWNGDPCDLTAEQREEINELLEEEFGEHNPFYVYCDPTWAAVKEIIEDIAGENWDGDPCSLTEEQIEAINEAIREEFGDRCVYRIHCDRDFQAVLEIIEEIAGENWDGNPCSLTEEQREDIDEAVKELLGIELGLSELPCDEMPGIFEGWEDENDQSSVVAGVEDILSGAQPNVFPQPAVDIATVSFTGLNGVATISVTDVEGNEVLTTTMQATAGDNNVQLNVGSLATGAYWVKVSAGTTTLKTAPLLIVR